MTGCGVICQATVRLAALAPSYFLLQRTHSTHQFILTSYT